MTTTRWRIPTSDWRVAFIWAALVTMLAVTTGLALHWYPGRTIVDCDACTCSDRAVPR